MTTLLQPTDFELNRQWSTTLFKRALKDDVKANEADYHVYTSKPAMNLGIQCNKVNDLFNELYSDIGNRGKSTRLKALQCAMYNLHTCQQGKNFGFLCRRSTASTKALKRYANEEVSRLTLAKVLGDLATLDLVKAEDGFRGEGEILGLATLWLPTEKLKALGVALGAEIIEFGSEPEVIVLKSENKTLIDYQDNEFTTNARQRVIQSNELRANYKWTYTPVDLDASSHVEPLTEDIEAFAYCEEAVELLPSSLACKRVFNQSFDNGGRFYCKAQNLRKVERETLHIDGQPTCEIDLKSLHTRLLYNKLGLASPEDCYDISGYNRSLIKHVAMLALNAKSSSQAVRNLTDKHGLSNNEASDVLEAYCSFHKPIRDNFFNSLSGELQFADSLLADSIIDRAFAKGIPVLPVHDSFITSTKHGMELLDIIKSVYWDVYGFKVPIGDFTNEHSEQLIKEIEGAINAN